MSRGRAGESKHQYFFKAPHSNSNVQPANGKNHSVAWLWVFWLQCQSWHLNLTLPPAKYQLNLFGILQSLHLFLAQQHLILIFVDASSLPSRQQEHSFLFMNLPKTQVNFLTSWHFNDGKCITLLLIKRALVKAGMGEGPASLCATLSWWLQFRWFWVPGREHSGSNNKDICRFK